MPYVPPSAPVVTPAAGNPVPADSALREAEAMWGQYVKDRFALRNEVYNYLQRVPCVDRTGHGCLEYKYRRQTSNMRAAAAPWNSDISAGWIDTEILTTHMYRYSAAVNYDTGLTQFSVPEMDIEAQLAAGGDAIAALANDMLIRGNPDGAAGDDQTQGRGAFAGLTTIAKSTGQVLTDHPVDLTALDVRKNDAGVAEGDYAADVVSTIAAIARVMQPMPSYIIANSATIAALSAVAMQYGKYQIVPNQWPDNVNTFGGLALIDAGRRACDITTDVLPTVAEADNNSREAKLTGKPDQRTMMIMGSTGKDSVFALTHPGDSIQMHDRMVGSHNKEWTLDYYLGLVCTGTNCLRLIDEVYVPSGLVQATKVPALP